MDERGYLRIAGRLKVNVQVGCPASDIQETESNAFVKLRLHKHTNAARKYNHLPVCCLLFSQ